MTLDELRSLHQVTHNAIASAVMREPLEMMVASYNDQPGISCFRRAMLTPVGYDDISVKLFC